MLHSRTEVMSGWSEKTRRRGLFQQEKTNSYKSLCGRRDTGAILRQVLAGFVNNLVIKLKYNSNHFILFIDNLILTSLVFPLR